MDPWADPPKRSMSTEQKSFTTAGFALITRRTRKREALDKTEREVPKAIRMAWREPHAFSEK